MSSGEITVEGLDLLNDALSLLPERLEQNWMRGAMRAGAMLQLAEAQRDVPVGNPSSRNAKIYGGYRGALRDSLRISTNARNGVVTSKVTAGGKSKKTGANTYYAHIVEGGAQPHEIRAKGGVIGAKAGHSLFFAGLMRDLVQHPGAKAHPFMKDALDHTASAAVEAVAAYLRERFAGADIKLPGPGNY
jgi:HK97 gp10 family phage protein